MFLFHLLHLTRFQVLYVGTYGFFLAQNDILLIWKVSVYLGTVQNNQTISMEQSPSWETNFMEPKVHYHIHKSPPTALYLGAGASFHLLKINFNIIFRSTHSCSEWSVSCGSPHLKPSQFDRPQNIWWAVQSAKLLTILFLHSLVTTFLWAPHICLTLLAPELLFFNFSTSCI